MDEGERGDAKHDAHHVVIRARQTASSRHGRHEAQAEDDKWEGVPGGSVQRRTDPQFGDERAWNVRTDLLVHVVAPHERE